ncbi:MAG: hypothetical protein A2W36_00275 [Chloroflexi bacterium RBG_16_58_14]|nr:MAG: hypothetical protein A2W36_00275 [Chloroflexi bacterium RBG_16_58_14]
MSASHTRQENRSQLDQPPNPGANQAQGGSLPVHLFMAVVVQLQDERNTARALANMGLLVIRLPSTGAFLGRRNVTLLVGLPENHLEDAVRVIGEQCRQRVEYISTPLEGAPLPIPIATPIPVGGATIFAIKVDHFEEF